MAEADAPHKFQKPSVKLLAEIITPCTRKANRKRMNIRHSALRILQFKGTTSIFDGFNAYVAAIWLQVVEN